MHELVKNIRYVLFMLFALPCLFAQTLPCPGEVGVGVEWLYMNAGIDYPYFIQKFEGFAGGFAANGPSELIAADEDWHSGYRLEFIYSACNCFNDVRVRWTHFPSFINSIDVEGLLLPVQNVIQQMSNFASDISIRDRYDFYYLDFLLGQRAIQCGCFNLELQGGIQYSHLSFKENIQYIFSSNSSSLPGLSEDKFKSHLWGLGLELGTEFSYSFWNCFNLMGRGYGTLLISKRTSSHVFTHITDTGADFSGDLLNVKDRRYWKVVPTANVRLGFSFFKGFDPFCCVNCLGIELGYEAIWFYHGMERIYPRAQNSFAPQPPSINDTRGLLRELISFTLHGPYLHVGLSF